MHNQKNVLMMAILLWANLACSGTKELFENAEIKKGAIVDKAKFTELPTPVQKYFAYSLAENQEYLNFLRLKHIGSFKTGPDKEWMNIKGKQYFRAQPPGFMWIGKTRAFKATDSYVNGQGRLSVYLFGFLRILNKKGETIDQAELLRWLGESVWMPTNLLPSQHISWLPVDNSSAKLQLTHQNLSVTYSVFFNEEGQITHLETERYMDNTLTKWIGELDKYKEINGMMVPTNIKASWYLDDRKYTYANFQVVEFDYNNPKKW